MAKNKRFVLVPVEVELMKTDDEPEHVGCIRMSSADDVKMALEAGLSFSTPEHAWQSLAKIAIR